MASPHLSLLGLRRNPFPPTPDAQSYFYTSQLGNDLEEVQHCIEVGKGFVLVTGEVGLGKSTFARRLLDTLEPRGVQAALVFNTFLQGRELLSAINHDFGITPQESMALDMVALNAFLLQQASLDRHCLLVIDDAQNLTGESLELVRLLCNLESGQEKLLQIVLVGQPELLVTLERESLRQLKSRIAKHVHLKGLSFDDVARYFEFRITEAGGAGRLKLEAAACKRLYQVSHGNPRHIHLILDRCLYGLVARRSQRITAALIAKAAADVTVGGSSAQSQPRKRWRYALATALSLPLAGIVGWTGHQLTTAEPSTPVANPAASTTAPQPPSTPPPAAQPAVDTPPETTSQAICLQKLAQSSGAADQAANHEIRTLQLPAGLAAHLAQDGNTCLYQVLAPQESAQEETGADWIVWRPGLRTAGLLSPPPNEAVRRLQLALATHGQLEEKWIDGRFGPMTRAALSRYQQKHGLPATGEPNDLTLLLLEKYDERLSPFAR